MENTIELVKEKIEDNIFGYRASLDISHMITIVGEDSGSGKSLIFKYFKYKSALDKTIMCINIFTIENLKLLNSQSLSADKIIMKLIKNCKGKLIVIDNADVLLNFKIREYIGFDKNNQYIIFTRDVTGLWATEHNMARIVHDDVNRTMYFDYWLKDLHKRYTGKRTNNLVEI